MRSSKVVCILTSAEQAEGSDWFVWWCRCTICCSSWGATPEVRHKPSELQQCDAVRRWSSADPGSAQRPEVAPRPSLHWAAEQHEITHLISGVQLVFHELSICIVGVCNISFHWIFVWNHVDWTLLVLLLCLWCGVYLMSSAVFFPPHLHCWTETCLLIHPGSVRPCPVSDRRMWISSDVLDPGPHQCCLYFIAQQVAECHFFSSEDFNILLISHWSELIRPGSVLCDIEHVLET